MYQRVGAVAFKKSLDNIRALCDALGNPETKFKSVHVAGTNGKGSTSNMLAAIFQNNGYQTGLYTSPHLFRFTERIKINGEEVSENFVISFVERIKPLIEQLQPSFFEITVAMAFDYFAQKQVDIAIIEVGLGGRLDSTNIIQPELSIITNIAYDHQDLLGETLTEIATEKAGIIKHATPVVIGEMHPETTPVFEQIAQDKNAPIYFAQNDFEAKTVLAFLNYQTIRLFDKRIGMETKQGKVFSLDLPGLYQTKNLATVMKAVELLRMQGWKLEEDATIDALMKVTSLTGFKGRMYCVSDDPIILCDVAHNEAGIKEVVKQLYDYGAPKLRIVLGMVRDKTHEKILRLLPDGVYYFVAANIPRALPAMDLKKKAKAFQLKGKVYDSVVAGLEAAIADCEEEDIIFVGGSVFVVGEVLSDPRWTHVIPS